MSDILLDIQGLTKVFGEGQTRVEALRGIDFRVRTGEFVAVMGPSGSGKSTLLHLIGALEPPTSGTIHIDGENLVALNDDERTLLRRRRIGFIFQAYNLLNVLTALENVALPLLIDGLSDDAANDRARNALRNVDLDSRLGHFPSQLSGGEQQRVAIARALVVNPLLVLADEPTGNLDTTSGDQIVRLLRELTRAQNQTALMVTHDSRLAARADRVVHLRDGRIMDEQPGAAP